MDEDTTLALLESVGAVITDSHIVYASGRHGSAYVNKDAVYPHTGLTSRLCRDIAADFANDRVDVVVAPAVGGVILSQWTAHHLSLMTGREVLGVYADKDEQAVYKAEKDEEVIVTVKLRKGDQLVIKKPEYVIKRGYDKLITGKRVLAVEDVLTTGAAARATVTATRGAGGDVVGVGVLCNRGGVTAHDVGDVPNLTAQVNVTLESWDERDCPKCESGEPVNTDVGKGREFLARKVC